MSLPNDIARCAGKLIDGEWREGCEDCRRRTDRRESDYGVWITPPQIIVFECEYRIEPSETRS